MILEHRDVVNALSEEAGLSKREAARMLQAFASVFQRNLIAGNELKIQNIGRFRRGAEASGGRKLNGKKIKGPVNVVYFKLAKSLRAKMRRFDYGRGRTKQAGNRRRGQGHERVLSEV